MAKHERNRFVATYHSIVAILVLLAGGGLLGVGIWLQTSGNGGVFSLDFKGDSFLTVILRAPIALMVTGIFLLVTGVVSLIAMGRKCVGVTFRIFYVVMAAIIAAVLVFICVFSTLVRINGGDQNVENFLQDAWDDTAASNAQQICNIEKHHQCRGFLNNDCSICREGTEPECAAVKSCVPCPESKDLSEGCYDKIINTLTEYSLPAAIVSGILAGVVLIDILLTCCL